MPSFQLLGLFLKVFLPREKQRSRKKFVVDSIEYL